MKKTIKISPVKNTVIIYDNIIYKNRIGDFLRDNTTLKMSLVLPFDNTPVFQKKPLLIWLEGGAWRNSSPCARNGELAWFAYRDIAVANVEYSVDSNNAWPACLEDVKEAIRFLRHNADTYGIDKDRIIIAGESAGAHLASLTGLTIGDPDYPGKDFPEESDAVNGVISFYGTGDTDVEVNDYIRYYDLLIRGNISENEELKKRINPMSYADKKTVPFLFFHGGSDTLVPIAATEHLYEKLLANGNEADFYVVEGAGHADLMFSQEPIREMMLDFIKKHI